ncbi:MAG: cation:proton antiporter [Deltaproteobacteria bacterium]|nr:MAG: cation:proton antiporter [Deltaproteobacteria bacterium]
MHLDPALPMLMGILFLALLFGMLFRKIKQPSPIAYLLTGVLVGYLGITEDLVLFERLGHFGVVFLLFFIGMELSLESLLSSWRFAFLGTLFQIAASVGLVMLLGSMFAWPIARSVLLGFALSLSSTAMTMKLLEEEYSFESQTGKDVASILIFQDLAVIPMFFIIGLFSPEHSHAPHPLLQLLGAVLLLGLLWLAAAARSVKVSWLAVVFEDKELQVIAALSFSLGLAYVSGVFGLSTALGAFVAGMIISSLKATNWFHHSLVPFRIVFVAVFFVSIGLLVDLPFLFKEWTTIGLLVAVAFGVNTLINLLILRALGRSWEDSLVAAALLSQIGEFSFVLAAVGYKAKIISPYAYQLTVLTISFTILLTPLWVKMCQLSIRWLQSEAQAV